MQLEALKIATDLLISSSVQVQVWITRFIVVNVALFSGLGVMVTWNQPPKLEAMALYVMLGICTLGVLASFIMFGVVWRQLDWASRQLDLVFKLQRELNVEVHVKRVHGGFFQKTFVVVTGSGVLLAWAFVAALIVEARQLQS